MWCDVMWCDVMWCDVMWRDVTWRDVTWRDVTWRDATRRDAMPYNAIQCNAIQCNAIQCNAMQCNAMQCNAIKIIIMNFYSHVSNTRCHSIGHKMRIARIKFRVESPGRWERAWGGNTILKRCVLHRERKTGEEFEFRVFQSRGPMTENALLPSDDLTYEMKRTSESEDLVETECDGNERLL